MVLNGICVCMCIDRQIEVQIDRQKQLNVWRDKYRQISGYLERLIGIHSWMFRQIRIYMDGWMFREKEKQIQAFGYLERQIQIHRQLNVQRQISQGKTRGGKCILRTVTDSSILSEGLVKRCFTFGFRILGKMEMIPADGQQLRL